MKRISAILALLGVVGCLCVCAQDKGDKPPKVKTLPDRYGKFKLGDSITVVERKVTPIYKQEPAPDVVNMFIDFRGKDVDTILLSFWKGKLAMIGLIFQQQYTLDAMKAVLIKKYGLPSKEEPIETVWADSLHIMILKQEYNVLDKGQRVTVGYGDLDAVQEMKALGGQMGRWPGGAGSGKGGGRDVPPK